MKEFVVLVWYLGAWSVNVQTDSLKEAAETCRTAAEHLGQDRAIIFNTVNFQAWEASHIIDGDRAHHGRYVCTNCGTPGYAGGFHKCLD